MSKMLAVVGATLGGAVGWWAGAHVGLMTAFVCGIVGTAAGTYAGRRVASQYLP
jgi:outer membrane lipoprotein SlyB